MHNFFLYEFLEMYQQSTKYENKSVSDVLRLKMMR